MAKTITLESFSNIQQSNYADHIVRKENNSIVKKLLFESNQSRKQGPQQTILNRVLESENCTAEIFFKNATDRKF